jgi:hypothetical protein
MHGNKDGDMKRIWVAAFVLFLCLPASGFGQSALLEAFPTMLSLAENVKVNPYVQVGYQWVGSNLNLPIQAEGLNQPLFIDQMDISLIDANFWSGVVGFTALAYEKYSFFAAAGGILGRPFVTSGTVPVSVNGGTTSANIQFTNISVESWFVQTGIGLGPVLLGLYWDHLGFELIEPRTDAGPIANQSVKGDILTKTFAPFLGMALPSSGATLTLIYSPLAYSNTQLSLRNSQNTFTEVRYSWNKPGDLVIGMVQYNTSLLSTVSIGLWCNYSWMRMRQSAELEFENTTPPIFRSKSVTATMTKYLAGVGLTLGINF